jgi:lipopolysaccharide transport system ATP-binding protein
MGQALGETGEAAEKMCFIFPIALFFLFPGVVSQLCNKAMLLDRGRIVMTGKTDAVIDRYINQFDDDTSGIQKEKRAGENQFTLAYMTDAGGGKRAEYRYDEEVVISLELFLDVYSADLELAMRLMDRYKNSVFTIREPLAEHYDKAKKVARVKVVIPSVFTTPGKYSWLMCINRPGVRNYDLQNDVLAFRVLETGSSFARYEGANYGSVFARYTIEKVTP